MEIIYRANDGTEFDSEQECVEYEQRFNVLCDKTNFVAFDEDFTPYNITGSNIEAVMEMMQYFICLNEDAVFALENVLSGFSYSCVAEDGVFKPNMFYGYGIMEEDEWYSFKNYYEYHHSKFERLMQIENTLSEIVQKERGE